VTTTAREWQPGDPLYNQLTQSTAEPRALYSIHDDHRCQLACAHFDLVADWDHYGGKARWPVPFDAHDLTRWT
jgi:hypothetical protein